MLDLILFICKANQRNEYPIYIRITIDRERAYIATGYFINAAM